MEQSNSEISKSNKKLNIDFKDSRSATGRRKRSIARVWVKKGSGKINWAKNYGVPFRSNIKVDGDNVFLTLSRRKTA